MKKIILISLISSAFLFGNPIQNTQPNKNVQSDKKVEQEANLLENNGWILPLIEKAKQMEKEQIIDACMYEFADDYDSAEEYYEETFKSE